MHALSWIVCITSTIHAGVAVDRCQSSSLHLDRMHIDHIHTCVPACISIKIHKCISLFACICMQTNILSQHTHVSCLYPYACMLHYKVFMNYRIFAVFGHNVARVWRAHGGLHVCRHPNDYLRQHTRHHPANAR
jgi:hypothetical protein